jgi:arylsulfatase A-like enzyme
MILVAGLVACSGPSPRNNGTNVLLIVLDTVRADRLSCYGYPRATTPQIDAVAARGVRFERCFANASWTLPSHASIFTGMYSVGHRATQETLTLGPGPATLAEVLSDAGYQTFGASTNGVVSVASGLARGFDRFIETFRSEYKQSIHDEAGHYNNIAFRRFLAGSDRDRPFFVFLNYIAAHLPYAPPEPHRSRFVRDGAAPERVSRAMGLRMSDFYMDRSVDDQDLALLSDLYDGEINFLDRWVLDLLDILHRDGRLEETLVVITSDHGENIGDHGQFAHVFSIYNTLLHVPLIVLFPGQARAGEVRTDTAQLLDLFPTILAECDVSFQGRPEGRALFAPGAERDEGPAMAEYYYPRQVLSTFEEDSLLAHFERFAPFMRRLRAIQNDKMKLVWGSDGGRELYRVATDPGERTDLLLAEPDHPAARELEAQLDFLVETHQGDTPLDPTPPVGWKVAGFDERIDDPELLERLRSLGYVK